MGDIMRKIWAVVFALGVLALLCLNVVPNAEGAGGWSSSVSPSFAFNGDNVTLTVTGIPGNFAFIKIMLVNETLDTQLVYLDEMGHGSTVWNVPILAQTGTYRFVVVANGVNVTEASVSIIFDDVTYLRWRVDNVEQDNEQLREIVQSTVSELNDIKGRIFWMWVAASITVAFAVCCGFVTILYYLPVVKIKMDEESRLNDMRGKMARTLKGVFDPDAPGLMLRAWPTMFEERKRERRGVRPFHMEPMAVVSDPEEPMGVRVYPLEIVGDEKPADEPFMKSENEMKDDTIIDEVPELNIIGKIRHKMERKKAESTSKDVKMEALLAELERLKKERHPETPERSEQPPSPSPAVGTTPEKPQEAVPDVIEEEVPVKPENAPKPRKKASAKPKSTKPRAKREVVPKEAVKEVVE